MYDVGHKASCQVKFSPRRLDGFGLTDGEAIERLWAYLRGFSAITKEMSASRRVDLLTDALLHLSRRNFSNAGKSLTSKLKKCLQLKIKTQQEMKDLFSELPGNTNLFCLLVTYDPEIVCQWEAREKEIMSRVYPEHKETTENWKVTYVQKLLHFKQLSATSFGCFEENQKITSEDYSIYQMSKKLYQFRKILKDIERKHSIKERWKPGHPNFDTIGALHRLSIERHFLITLRKKYADGQKIATRLSRQITKITNKMKLTIQKHNAAIDSLRDFINSLPDRLTFEKAKDPTSDLYEGFESGEDDILGETSVPVYTKRKTIEMYLILKRCDEEEKLLNLEIERLLLYYTNLSSKIYEALAYIGDWSSDEFMLGSKHEMIRFKTKLRNELFSLKKSFELPLGETFLLHAEIVNLTNDVNIPNESESSPYEESDTEDENIGELSEVDSDIE
ncbi:uncharacterized protein LOC124459200 isoform X2 [Xenia sp. Carnegie-2017]|uniref:uncharacterized protein LOC124459200 isoform X2 n=1 Tax=Xenia sp. Carnegie-2017 TaxID=2897299 RepID=UPI001F04B794|nr:uncharacterized protein LOC124459200 isoform X2 [Xenia sp. Carnegie-2017]XP_046864675.1 uncharacterized protein LOC124459200 isoform X2 [Xenia sp. Carnegie-2017]